MVPPIGAKRIRPRRDAQDNGQPGTPCAALEERRCHGQRSLADKARPPRRLPSALCCCPSCPCVFFPAWFRRCARMLVESRRARYHRRAWIPGRSTARYRWEGHSLRTSLHSRRAVANKGCSDCSGRSGLHLVWHAIWAQPVGRLQLQSVRSRPRKSEQPQRSLHQRPVQRSPGRTLGRIRPVPQ